MSSLLGFYENVFKAHDAVVVSKTPTGEDVCYGLNYPGGGVVVQVSETNARHVVFWQQIHFDFDVTPEVRNRLLERVNQHNSQHYCVKLLLLPHGTTLQVSLQLIVAKPEDVRDSFVLFCRMVSDAATAFSTP